jgi:hypothetical protein
LDWPPAGVRFDNINLTENTRPFAHGCFRPMRPDQRVEYELAPMRLESGTTPDEGLDSFAETPAEAVTLRGSSHPF